MEGRGSYQRVFEVEKVRQLTGNKRSFVVGDGVHTNESYSQFSETRTDVEKMFEIHHRVDLIIPGGVKGKAFQR